MTLKEFAGKNGNTKIDYDGKYGFQCVDVFRQYCQDVWNIPHTGGVAGAKDLYEKYESLPLEQKYLDKIPYKQGLVPPAGCAVIFGKTPSNKYGHVAIVLSASNAGMKVFEQDGYEQGGTRIMFRTYSNVLGFLNKKRKR